MNKCFLEVRIPISPKPHFFNQVRYLATSLRSLGPPYDDTRFLVSVGDENDPFDIDAVCPWARDEGIIWSWTPKDAFLKWRADKFRYVGTMMDRFREPFTSKFVIIADADILFMRPMPEVWDRLEQTDGVAGSMAHVSPFIEPFSTMPPGSHQDWWLRFFAAYDLRAPILVNEHPAFGLLFNDRSARRSPAYFNSGVIFGTGNSMNRLAAHAISATEAVRSVHDTIFCDQIAFTLMMYKGGVAIDVLPMRYNYPNDPGIESAFPEQLADVAVIHYLRHEIVNRVDIFRTEAAMQALLARTDLVGVNEALRHRMVYVHEYVANW